MRVGVVPRRLGRGVGKALPSSHESVDTDLPATDLDETDAGTSCMSYAHMIRPPRSERTRRSTSSKEHKFVPLDEEFVKGIEGRE